MQVVRFVVGLIAVSVLSGCAAVTGGLKYAPPEPPEGQQNSRPFDADADSVWRALIAHVGDTFFVIDNMEKDSYFLNLSFSAKEPTEYVDCGHVTSEVANARGPRTYSFPAASASEEYEATNGGHLYFISRQISLSGKANVLLTSVSPSKTQVKVTTRYIVRKTAVQRTPMDIDPPQNLDATVSFSTGEAGDEPTGMKMRCLATLALERGILDGVAAKLPREK
jgi:hypothetical protein